MSTSNVNTSAGSKLLISTLRPATYDLAGFKQLVWIEVAEITDLGEFGREYSQVTHSPLSSRRIVKRKGSFNEGSITIPMARDATDQGQSLMTEASLSDESFGFCIVLQDNTRHYFTAQCASYKTSIGGVDSITVRTAQLEVDNAILEEASISYSLNYSADSSEGLIAGQALQTVARGATGTPVFAQATASYKFVKWSDGRIENPRVDVDIQTDITTVAAFEAI